MNLEEGVKVISFARTDHEEEEEAAEGETPAGGLEQAVRHGPQGEKRRQFPDDP